MDIVFSQDPRDFARRDWSALVTADPAGTVFHTPAFLKLYWEEFADQPDHLLLAFAEEDGEQVGAVAFERLDDTLRFLGGTEVTDYMGPVALPEARPDRREGAVRGARPHGRLDRGRPPRPPGGSAVAGSAHRGGCGARVRDRGPRRPERGRAVPRRCPDRTTSTSNACRPSSVTRSSARRAAWRPRSARGTSAWPPPRRSRRSSTGSSSSIARARARRASSCSRGWRSSSAGSARRSCRGDLQPDVHRDGGAPEAGRLDRFPVRGHLLALQLGVRSLRTSPCRPGWCSWPRTSASRSRPGARRSTC